MSNLAPSLAARPERPVFEPQPRHIEIVPTRAQRRARPRVSFALITIAGLFALFMAQLLLSITIADGAYQISSLRAEQRDLARSGQAVGEKLDLLESPQNLAKQAENLGMVVSNTTPMFLRLSDGKVLGDKGAVESGTQLLDAGNLVPNSLLPGHGKGKGKPSNAGKESQSGAPAVVQPDSDVASSADGVLPSPTTR